MKLVSVILPTYNRGFCIKKSIESVLDQTYTEIELLIVDDGSTDDTRDIVEEIRNQDGRVRYIPLSENGGVCKARNAGMKEAKGDYIAFQDSDDFWVVDKLEKQMKALEENQADFSFTYIEYDRNGRQIIIPSPQIPVSAMNGNLYPQLLKKNVIGAPTLVMSRRCYEEIGEFENLFPALEDYDYALRLGKRFKGVFISEPLLKAVIYESGISSNPLNHIMASCLLVGKYKGDLLESGIFNEKILEIMDDAKEFGAQDQILPFLEKCLSLH